MKRTKITYGQLDQALRSLGFTCTPSNSPPPARIYDHKELGASVSLPAFPLQDFVLEYHLTGVRVMFAEFGIPDPTKTAEDLQTAG